MRSGRLAAAWGGGVGDLGPEWDRLLGPGVQNGRDWFAATAATAVPEGARAATLQVRDGDAPAGLLPMLLGPGARSSGLCSPYTVLFQPGMAGDGVAVGRAMGRLLRRWPATVLEGLDPAWPGLAPLLAGLRRAGLATLRFDGFGNWHERVTGGWEGYLAGRPGALRETIRRKGRTAERAGDVRFGVVRDGAGLSEGLDAFEAVYRRSWKEPEPFPGFTAALLRRLAPRGEMRLAVMWRGQEAVAAQYWTVADGVATVLKLAHDEGHKALSPGTLLTAHAVRGLIDEGVRELDFGRGDDPYKRQWAAERRQRVGVVLANPLRAAGLRAIVRHAGGLALRTIRR